jgi:hypothetical protein
MIAGSTLAFPSSRTLAGWWRQLAALQPQALWVGHLFLHAIEANVRLRRSHRPDRFTQLILQAVVLENTHASAVEPGILERLDARLQLGRAMTGQLLRQLAADGLLEPKPSGWDVSTLGRRVIDQGHYPRDECRRQVFHFVDCNPLSGAPRERPPRFILLENSTATPWTPEPSCQFDVALLDEALRQTEEWKQRQGFPLDVHQLFRPDAADLAANWHQVIVDRPARLFVALVQVSDSDAPALVGFGARPENWSLQSGSPMLRLRAGHELFSELSRVPELEAWRQAWRSWCQSRGIDVADADACRVQYADHRVRVQLATRVLDHLRATRSEALKGDTWVLAGDGAVRAAAPMDMTGDPE